MPERGAVKPRCSICDNPAKPSASSPTGWAHTDDLPCPGRVRSRWEIVARMHVRDLSWIVPVSEGRHYRSTWLAARLRAWRWTRRDRRVHAMTWEVRHAR